MHASTIATILKQVETNLGLQESESVDAKASSKKASSDGAQVSVKDVCDEYITQTKFFEDAIVHEQVFQLRTLHTIANTEF